ncbi:MDR family MFS transporter [Gulosibacter sp. 10]|uniref:MDR family MFS transporter n=1 Tax=Gulosibacter sp. 10 TaxID=1255570 RepID=UPI00097EF094|nr:MDR family MFS transporter [Gulosibacter sp. 10]SJM57010.1 permease of the major facilitator superfamily [Gulosibacter sp. 10]
MAEVTRSIPAGKPKRRSIVPLFITLMLTMLLASLSQMVLASALPTIVGELHGVEHMMWVTTAYLLTATIMMPIYGNISDLLGRKPVLLTAIGIFVAGSVIGAVAGDMEVLIVARLVQGLGGGGLMILSQAAIADVVPARDRGKYMGILGGVFAFSSVAGPLIGGWLTEGPGWRWAFWMNVPLGLIALVATIVLLRLPSPDAPKRRRIDYLGMAALAAGTSTLILVATWGGSTYEWASPQIIGLAAATVVFAALFILIESRVAEPIMPMSMFKDRNISLTTFAGLLIALPMFGAIGYMPTYFQMAVGANPQQAGLLMIPMMAAMLTVSIVTGIIISRTGRYKIMPLIGVTLLTAFVALLSTVTLDTPVFVICLYMGGMGVGLGMSQQVLTLIVQNAVPHRLVGTATAANNYFRQVGGSLGSAVVGSLFVGRLSSLMSERLPEGQGPADGAASLTPDLIHSLPAEVQEIIVSSYNEALIPIFLFMAPIVLVTVLMLIFVREKPLATSIDREVVTDSIAHGQLPATTGSINIRDVQERDAEEHGRRDGDDADR